LASAGWRHHPLIDIIITTVDYLQEKSQNYLFQSAVVQRPAESKG